MACLCLRRRKNECFALRIHVVGVGKILPVRLESREIMRSRPMKAGLLWRTSKLFSLLARLAS